MIRRHSADHLVLSVCCASPLSPEEVTRRVHTAQRRAGQRERQLMSEDQVAPTLRNLLNLRLLRFGHKLSAEGENTLAELGPWRPQ